MSARILFLLKGLLLIEKKKNKRIEIFQRDQHQHDMYLINKNVQSYADKSPAWKISLSLKVSSMFLCKSSRPMVRFDIYYKCIEIG